ncbi:MAG: hypothetical protein V4663_04895 [Bacteroidota bacterium]
MKKRIVKRAAIAILALIVILNVLDVKNKIVIPVEHATSLSWDKDSYWAYPCN